MRQFKILFAMLFLLLVGNQAQALEYSNLCEVMKTATPQSKGLASQITLGMFACDADQGVSVLLALEGSNSTAVKAIKPILVNAGRTDASFSKPSPFLDSMTTYLTNIGLGVTGLIAVFLIWKFLYDKAKTGSLEAAIKNNTIRMVALLLLFCHLVIVSVVMLLFAIFGFMISNQHLLSSNLNELAKSEDYNVIRSEEKMVFSANIERINDIATEDLRTIDAMFANNRVALGEAGYTRGEILKISADAGLKVSKDKSWGTPNVDATTNWKNILNWLNEVKDYSMKKSADDYPFKDQVLKGYPASFGKFIIGSNGADVEQLTGESLNDGTMRSMFEKGAKTSNEMLGGSSTYLKNTGTLGRKYYAQIMDDNFQTNSMNVVDGKFDAEEQAIVDDAYAKSKEVMGILKLDEIGVSTSSVAEVIKSKFASGFLSAYMGHDFDADGASFQNIINYFKNTIVKAKLNEYCTDTWSEHESSRRAINQYNELPNDVKGSKLNRDQGWDSISDFDMQCATLNPISLKIEILGSENQADVLKFRAVQLAYLTAANRAFELYYIGVKKALQENKEGIDMLTYEVLTNSTKGILGSALSASSMSKFRNNKNISTQTLKNAFFVHWDNADIKNYNYVNRKVLCGIQDVRPEGQSSSCNLVPFAPVDYKGLYLSAIINVTPSTLLDDGSWFSKFDFNKLIMDAIGFDFTSIKLMAGFDPSLSIMKGRAECAANPQSCANNYHIGLAGGMYMLGNEMFDFGVKIILLKALTAVADGTLDSIIEMIGSSDSSSAGIKTGQFTGNIAKFLGSFSGKTVQIALKSMDIIMSAYLPLGYVFAALGFFCKYVIPLALFFMLLGRLISFIYFAFFFKFIEAPVLFSYGAISGNPIHLQRAGWKLVYLAWYMPVLALFMKVISFTADNMNAQGLIAGILGMSDGSFIGDILAILATVIFIIFCIFSIYKSGMDQFDSTMKVIGNEDAPADDSANRMYALLFANNRMQNAISSSVPALEKGFKNLVANNLKAKQYEAQRKERNRQAREEFSKEEHKNKQTTEGEA